MDKLFWDIMQTILAIIVASVLVMFYQIYYMNICRDYMDNATDCFRAAAHELKMGRLHNADSIAVIGTEWKRKGDSMVVVLNNKGINLK